MCVMEFNNCSTFKWFNVEKNKEIILQYLFL